RTITWRWPSGRAARASLRSIRSGLSSGTSGGGPRRRRHPAPGRGGGGAVGACPRPAGEGRRVRLVACVLGLGQVAGDGEQLAEQPGVGAGVEAGEAVVGHWASSRGGRARLNLPQAPTP